MDENIYNTGYNKITYFFVNVVVRIVFMAKLSICWYRSGQ